MTGEQALREELARIVDAVAIESPAAFTLGGRPSSGIALPVIGLHLTPDMPPLMNELVMQLYQHCFANRFAGQAVSGQPPPTANDPEWVGSLARANQSRERWEDEWRILHTMPNGGVVAQRGKTTRTLAPGEFINLSGSGMVLSPGTFVRVYVPRESRTVQAGYYFAFGETLPDSNDELSVVRFYWNVSGRGSCAVVASDLGGFESLGSPLPLQESEPSGDVRANRYRRAVCAAALRSFHTRPGSGDPL